MSINLYFCKPLSLSLSAGLIPRQLQRDRVMSLTAYNHAPKYTSKMLKSLAFIIAISASPAWAATYYVRTDGGSAAQCNGKSDAAYPGSGSNQACAWKSIYYALPANSAPRIVGGDTLIIGPGEHQIGWGAPGSADTNGRCYDGGRYDCYLPPIPSGPSANAKTRILGKGHDTGCATAPKLWGTERVSTIINMQGSSNVELACLEITDKSDCVESHSDGAARCKRDTVPYGNWASVGLSATNSQNVILRNINIHGLANRGILAGGLTNWTMENIKINANGWAGWDGDVGANSSNSGQIVMRNIEIAWNGCGERWQTGEIHACWAQEGGGYGDGLGTGRTGGQWLIENGFIHHNTSDGIDLLYMDNAANTSITLRRVWASANAGNQLKTSGNAVIENSVVVGNCSYFNGKYNMRDGDNCRALGNALSVGLADGRTVTVRHNTVISEGDCVVLSSGGNNTATLNVYNNALLGMLDWRSNRQGNAGELSCGHYADQSSAKTNFNGNLLWKVKSNQCPSGSVCNQDPKMKSLDVNKFDPEPLDGSPLIDKAPLISDAGRDFFDGTRPFGNGPDIGAVEKRAGGGGAPDSQAPTVTASFSAVTGNSIQLSASASDNIGVSSVEFRVNGVVLGTSTTAPYAVNLDIRNLGYGQHQLVVNAYDAAGNVGKSTTSTFSVFKGAYRLPDPIKSDGKDGSTTPVVPIVAPVVTAPVTAPVATTPVATGPVLCRNMSSLSRNVAYDSRNKYQRVISKNRYLREKSTREDYGCGLTSFTLLPVSAAGGITAKTPASKPTATAKTAQQERNYYQQLNQARSENSRSSARREMLK